VHEVTLSTGEVVEQRVPAIVTPELQQVALARLDECCQVQAHNSLMRP
jgi:hypothetical protein